MSATTDFTVWIARAINFRSLLKNVKTESDVNYIKSSIKACYKQASILADENWETE